MKSLRCDRGPCQTSGVVLDASTSAPAHRHPSPTAPILVHEVEARGVKAQPAREKAAACSTALAFKSPIWLSPPPQSRRKETARPDFQLSDTSEGTVG